MKRMVALAAVCAGALAMAGEPVDGHYVYGPQKVNWNEGTLQTWLHNVHPHDGGIVYVNETSGKSSNDRLTQNLSDLTLGGFEMENGTYSFRLFVGKPIKLSGDAFFQPGWTVGNGWLYFGLDFNAADEGETVAHFRDSLRGCGTTYLYNQKFSGFKSVDVSGGYVRVGSNSTVCVTKGDVRLAGGALTYSTDGVSGAAAAEMATDEGAMVTVGAGAPELRVNKGAASSATLTLGAVTNEHGGTLTVWPTALANLGNTEKVKINGAAAGLLPAWMAIANPSSPFGLYFAAYDSEKGVVPATEGVTVIGAGNATISEPLAAARVVVSNVSPVVNAKLTIGDEKDAGGLMFWACDTDGKSTIDVTGDGSIEFANEGVVWFASSKSRSFGRWFYFSVPLCGTNGITLAAATTDSSDDGHAPIVSLAAAESGAFTWRGALHLDGVRFLYSTNAVPAESEIHVNGSQKRGGGQFYVIDGANEVPNRMFLSGRGLNQGNDAEGAVEFQSTSSTQPTLTFTNVVTLVNDAVVNARATGSGKQPILTFAGPVAGDASLVLSGTGEFVMKATNTYTGVTRLDGQILTLENAGTLGAGAAEIHGTLKIRNAADKTITNAVANVVGVAATVQLENSSAAFAGKVGVQCLNLDANSTLAVKDFTADTSVSIPAGARVVAVDDESTISVGAESDAVVNGRFADGAGKLAVAKTGAGTLTLVGVNDFTGGLAVNGGTLRIRPVANVPFGEDVSYWLDASKTNTMAFAADGVTVTNWASAVGDGFAMVPAGKMPYSAAMPDFKDKDYGCPRYVERTDWVTGKTTPAVFFPTSTVSRLYGNRVASQATVFIVTLRRESGWAYGGLFGGKPSTFGQNEYGVRGNANWGKNTGFDATVGNYFFDADGKFVINGKTTNVHPDLKPFVIVMDGKEKERDFTPALGGYMPSHANNPYRPWGGEYAEVLAYNRTLSEAERKEVENYLAAKWLGKTFYDGVTPTFPQVAENLPAANAVSVNLGAKFDLGGADQTVASLSGEGEIVNTGAPATLRVTGSSSFVGKVGANVTLLLSGGVAALDVDEGAALGFSGEATELAPCNLDSAVPTNGVVFWLDANRPDTIKTLDDGYTVTNWESRVPWGKSFAPLTGDAAKFGKYATSPMYLAPGKGGFDDCKPSVHFGLTNALTHSLGMATASTNGMTRIESSEAVCPPRTLFIAFLPEYGRKNVYNSFGGLYGCGGYLKDCGIRINTSGTGMELFGYAGVIARGDLFRMNGTVYASNPSYSAGPKTLVCVDYNQVKGNCTKTDKYRQVIGEYHSDNKRYLNGYVAEVIGYDRVLSETEYLEVEKYLTEKWHSAGAIPAAKTSAWEGVRTLVVPVGADGAAATAKFTGDVDLSKFDLRVDTFDSLSRDRAHVIVEATGAISGKFNSANVPSRRWVVRQTANTWSIVYNGGTAIIIR